MRWFSRELSRVKKKKKRKANPKRLHAIRFHLYNIFERTDLWIGQTSSCQGLEGEANGMKMAVRKGACDDGAIPCADCGNRYTNLHTWWHGAELNIRARAHTSTIKMGGSEEGRRCQVDILIALQFCNILRWEKLGKGLYRNLYYFLQ